MNEPETRTILVGVDGSQGSIQALIWAASLAENLGTTVTAAMAGRRPRRSDRSSTNDSEHPPEDLDAQLVAQIRRTTDAAGLEYVDRLPLRGTAYEALIEASARSDVAMLVVGTRGLGPIAGLLLGSVSRRLLFGTKCPLILVPQEAQPLEIDHVVVGLDGSPVSEAAASWTATLCLRLGAAATVVRCIDPGAEHSSERLDEIITVSHLTFEKDHCAVFRGLGVAHEAAIENGDARICLIETAKAKKAGLIVVGQHGEGQFTGLGGTASYLVRHSPLPLAVIPKARDLETMP